MRFLFQSETFKGPYWILSMFAAHKHTFSWSNISRKVLVLVFDLMSKRKIIITILYHAVTILGIPDYCPKPSSRAKETSEHCAEASDPNELPKSGIEKWFTKEMFEVTIVIAFISTW